MIACFAFGAPLVFDLCSGGAGGAAPSGPRTHTIQITMEEKQQLDNVSGAVNSAG